MPWPRSIRCNSSLEWVDRLAAIIETLHRVVQVLFAMLGLGVLLIVGNTIRLGIENRREEIRIIRLFGATDAFHPTTFSVRRIVVWAHRRSSRMCGGRRSDPAGGGAGRTLVALYSGGIELIGLEPSSALVVAAAGGVLGLAGAWIAVSPGARRGIEQAVSDLSGRWKQSPSPNIQ